MRRLCYYLLVASATLFLPSGTTQAALTDYLFSVGTGTAINPSYSDIWSGFGGSRGYYAGQTSTVSLPFTFRFNSAAYTQITVSSHGLIAFGSSVNSGYSNSLNGTSDPVITPFWDNLYIGGGAPYACAFTQAIQYGTSGSSPNRIFVINYESISRGYCDGCEYGPMFMDFQVRLYEGSNKIEFYYENATSTWPSCISSWWGTGSTSTSASIGLAVSSTDYVSVTPSGSSASISRTSVNNSVNLVNTTITANTVYTFRPCAIAYTGNVAQGGTTAMNSGDVLLSSFSVERGATQMWTPFTVSLLSPGCETRNLTFVITGANAADFAVSPSGAYNLSVGVTQPVNITFTPQAIGVRTATLTITDNLSPTRTYTLRATALPRISWTPNLASGGTPGLVSGDTLIKDIIVLRGTPRDFTPFTILNFSTNGAIPPAVITFVIDSAGTTSTQYTLQTTSPTNLGPGQSVSPIVRFLGTGLGVQHARLTVNADGETRVFHLKAISGAPGITITPTEGVQDPLGPQQPLYHQVFSCVGNQANIVPMLMTNPGQFPMTVTSIDIYQTDTADGQGTPRFPLSRDAQGRVIRMVDYALSTTPGVFPIGANPPISVPFTLQPNESRTIYATFIGQLPGKRFGRAYISTDAQNAFGTDTAIGSPAGVSMGLLNFDFIGRAIGADLAATSAGVEMKTVIFAHTRAGDSAFMSFPIANAGACDLRINRDRFRIHSGDVNEFRMMGSLRNATFDATTGDYVLAPGMADTITVRFTPSRPGSRMATMMIQTNDSTIVRPGVSERGAFYLDLTGRGLAGLDTRDLVLDPVVIGSFVIGDAVFENSSNAAVGVASVGFVGDDAAEFSENAAVAWPARPFNVLPGEKLHLSVRMTPLGSAGLRRTTMELITTTFDTVRLKIRGEAGTQTLVVAPSSLFDNVTLAIGQTKRQTVMISNTGTLPVRITDIALNGPDSLAYRMGILPRRDLEAGQTEYLEVTFVPTIPGQTSAQIVVTASNGQTYTVALGGTGLRVRRDPGDPTTSTRTDGKSIGRRGAQGGTTTRGPVLK